MNNELKIGSRYVMRFMINGTLLTYTGLITDVTDDFVLFTDAKKGESIGYRKCYLSSFVLDEFRNEKEKKALEKFSNGQN